MDIKRIGVMADSFRLGFAGGLKRASAMGVGAVQVYASGELAPSEMSAVRRAEALKLARGMGLRFSAICGELGGHGIANATENEWKISELCRIIELTADLDCDVMTTHIGVIPADPQHPRRKTMREAMEALSQRAAPLGVRIAIETGPEPTDVLRSFLDEFQGVTVGVNYDPANIAMVLGLDPVAGVSVVRDRIFHTHVKDGRMLKFLGAEPIYDFFAEGGIGDLRLSDYFVETRLGQGSVDFKAWVAALGAYTGFFTIEREVGEHPEKDIADAVAFLEAL